MRHVLQGVPRSLSSTSAELGGILLALRSQPSNVPVNIISDSQSALTIARPPSHEPRVREALKQFDSVLRTLIHSIIRKRTALTLFEWVRGHSGDPMNDRADAAANEGRLVGAPQLLPPVVICSHNQFSLYAGLKKVDHYERWLVKVISRYAHTSVFLGCSQGAALAALTESERTATFAAI